MDKDDTILFIDHRLKVAGNTDGGLFTQDAKEMIYDHTKGFPRKIVVLCHALIIDMLTQAKEQVDSSLVFSRIKTADLFNG